MPIHTHYSLFSIFIIINNEYLLILSTANILIFNGYTYFKIKIAICNIIRPTLSTRRNRHAKDLQKVSTKIEISRHGKILNNRYIS